MSEEHREPWLNYLALVTIILAVCTTIATFKEGGYSTQTVLSQMQASNHWGYFQSKSIKNYLFEIRKEQIEIALKTRGDSLPQSVVDEYHNKINEYSSKLSIYEAEKNKIATEARKLEKERDDAQRHEVPFARSVIFLNIAIFLSSIAAVMKVKYLWYIGMLVGVYGMIQFCNGFFLF